MNNKLTCTYHTVLINEYIDHILKTAESLKNVILYLNNIAAALNAVAPDAAKELGIYPSELIGIVFKDKADELTAYKEFIRKTLLSAALKEKQLIKFNDFVDYVLKNKELFSKIYLTYSVLKFILKEGLGHKACFKKQFAIKYLIYKQKDKSFYKDPDFEPTVREAAATWDYLSKSDLFLFSIKKPKNEEIIKIDEKDEEDE